MAAFEYLLKPKIARNYRQVLSTLAVSLGSFAVGLGKGYSSPALASLQEEPLQSSVRITAQEGSWIASLSFLGALLGCFFGGLMLRLGRKRALLVTSLPFSGCWLLTVFAHRVEMIYGTALIAGFCSAVTLLVTQVYITEIAHPEIRGFLSAISKMAGHLGTLTSFTVGAFLNWRQLALVCSIAPVTLFFAVVWVPETPSFLLLSGRVEEAVESFRWLRSKENGEEVSSEMETLRRNIMSKEMGLLPKRNHRPFPFPKLLVTCGLMFFQKFSGVIVFFHYAVPIITEVHGKLMNPHAAAIQVVILQLVGSMTSGLLVDTVGRIPLLLLSVVLVSGSLFGFGTYTFFVGSMTHSNPYFIPSLSFLPMLFVFLFTSFYAIGIGPLSWLMVAELFPLEYRALGCAISTAFSYACAFTAVKTYVDLRAFDLGLYGTFWIYSGVSVFGTLFVFLAVPETRGVELDEMMAENNIDLDHTASRDKGDPRLSP